MNNWWGRGGGGAPSFTNRRHNVASELDRTRAKWVYDRTFLNENETLLFCLDNESSWTINIS